MRARGRIGAGLAIAAFAGAMALAPAAQAAPANVIGGVAAAPDPNVFSAPTYDHEAGTVATLTWAAGGSHDVAASANGPDGQKIFSSDTIPSGTTPIKGSQYLAPGVYPFICTIHFGMSANLNVNSGTPQARPAVTVRLLSKKIAKVQKKGKVTVGATITGTEPASIKLLLGKQEIGSAPAPRSGNVVVTLSKKGKAALQKKSKATIKVAATVPFGSPAEGSGKLK